MVARVDKVDPVAVAAHRDAQPIIFRRSSEGCADFGQVPGIGNGARQQLFETDVEFVKIRLRLDETAKSEQLAQFDEAQRAYMR
jgi:hypothetical protein